MNSNALHRATRMLAISALIWASFALPVLADDTVESTITVAYAMPKTASANAIERSNDRDARRIAEQTRASLDDDAASALAQRLGSWLTPTTSSNGDD